LAINTGQKLANAKIIAAPTPSTASARTIASALGARLVDRGADRGLRGEREQPADRGHQSDLGQAPMLPSDQKHIEIRPEGAAHVGEQEVDGVKRQRVETPAPG
jgi:hypothetical protein